VRCEADGRLCPRDVRKRGLIPFESPAPELGALEGAVKGVSAVKAARRDSRRYAGRLTCGRSSVTPRCTTGAMPDRDAPAGSGLDRWIWVRIANRQLDHATCRESQCLEVRAGAREAARR
jgi:hypothetical protein